MATLELPRLAGTREAVSDLLADRGIALNLAGEDLVVFARALASGSPAFADELVREVLDVRGADHLTLVGSPGLFAARVREAARRRGVHDKFRESQATEVRV